VSQATRAGQLTLGDYLDRAWREGAMWGLVCVAVYLLVALASYSPGDPGWSFVGQNSSVNNAAGPVGAWFADVALFLLGAFAYLLPLMVAWSGYLVFRQRALEPETKLYWLALRWTGFLLLLTAGSALANMHLTEELQQLPNGVGGGLGLLVTNYAELALGKTGGSLGLTALFLVGFMLATSITPLQVIDWLGALTLALFRAPVALLRRLGDVRLPFRRGRDSSEEQDDDDPHWEESESDELEPDRLERDVPRWTEHVWDAPDEPARVFGVAAQSATQSADQPAPGPQERAAAEGASRAGRRRGRAPTDLSKLALSDPLPDDRFDESPFSSPFSSVDGTASDRAAAAPAWPGAAGNMSRELGRRPRSSTSSPRWSRCTPGPWSRCSSWSWRPGVKVSKITGLAKDIARALSKISVRVVEVIPGKSVIGLEVPNDHREMVVLSEILGSAPIRRPSRR
jgi:S-DNA-T family DNA segregation ATPase FtsK/SpoIIIE